MAGFREIGQVDNVCPYCLRELAKRPHRKTACPHCRQSIFARKRPLDERIVLLTADDALLIEEDWRRRYEIESRKSRPLSPEWQERFDVALTTDVDADPEVEAAARTAFAAVVDSIRRGVAPRDSTDAALEGLLGEFRARVARRLWQLQVRSMTGRI